MIRIQIEDCAVDILPIVQGLVSESDKISENYGKYEAYGLSLSVEGIEALKKRSELEDDYEVSELDLVYAQRMTSFGEVQMPCPAFCELVDRCTNDKKGIIALDMNDEDFTTAYIENIKATEFVKEHRMAKKGMKHRFDMSSAESFAMDWDMYVNKVKGYRKVSEIRERYIAEQIKDAAKYRNNLLVVLEIERVNNIVNLVKAGSL